MLDPRQRPPFEALREESLKRLRASERAVEAQFNEARLLASLAVALLLVGFLLVAQWRGNSSAGASLDSATDGELAIIIQEMTAENSAMRSEALRLEVRLAEAGRDERGRADLLAEAQRELGTLQAVSGSAPAVGEGVVVRIADTRQVLVAQDLVNLVHELRSGGAEAISVSGQRMNSRSAFVESKDGIRLDGTLLPRTLEVAAIGPSASLKQALALPGGLAGTLSTFPGVQLKVDEARELMLPAAPALVKQSS